MLHHSSLVLTPRTAHPALQPFEQLDHHESVDQLSMWPSMPPLHELDSSAACSSSCSPLFHAGRAEDGCSIAPLALFASASSALDGSAAVSASACLSPSSRHSDDQLHSLLDDEGREAVSSWDTASASPLSSRSFYLNPPPPAPSSSPASLSAAAVPLSTAAGSALTARMEGREQRMLRRKLQHQQLDMARRHREASAVQRLHQLSQSALVNPMQSHTPTETEEKAAADASSASLSLPAAGAVSARGRRSVRSAAAACSADGGVEDERPSKVQMLEAAVERMERLVHSFHRHCTDIELRDRHIAALQQRLAQVGAASTHSPPPNMGRPLSSAGAASSPLSPPTFSFLSRLDSSAALRVFIRPLISLLLIRLPDFVVVDANQQHELETGWPTAAIVNKSLSWSCSKQPRKHDHDLSYMCPLVKKIEPPLPHAHDGSRLVRRVHQYPSSGSRLKELLGGMQQRAELLWRFYRPDGGLYETPCTAWLAARESRDESSGEVVVAPAGFVCMAAATADVVKVDEWDSAGTADARLRLPLLRGAELKCKCFVYGNGVDTY